MGCFSELEARQHRKSTCGLSPQQTATSETKFLPGDSAKISIFALRWFRSSFPLCETVAVISPNWPSLSFERSINGGTNLGSFRRKLCYAWRGTIGLEMCASCPMSWSVQCYMRSETASVQRTWTLLKI